MALVSLIIPCYNMERYIDKCIDSVLSQTHQDIQLIIVNDGSTDKSEELLLRRKNEIEGKMSEYIYLYQQNSGVASACCNAFKYVAGKYLILLDGDDTLMPESVKKQHDFLEANEDYALVRTNGWYFSEKNDKIERLFNDKEEKGDLFTNLLTGKSNNWCGSYMIRMTVLDEIYPDRNIYLSRGGQNLQFILASSYKRKCGYINEPLMKYTVKDNSLSHFSNDEDKKRIKALLSYKDIRKHIVNSVTSGEEKEKYNRILDVTYARIFMGYAVSANDRTMLKNNYMLLKDYGVATLKDKITYYNVVNPVLGVFYRIINKLGFR